MNNQKVINEAYDNLLKSSQLTEENIGDISQIMEKAVNANQDLKFLNELKSNNGIESVNESEIQEDQITDSVVNIDPITGNITNISEAKSLDNVAPIQDVLLKNTSDKMEIEKDWINEALYTNNANIPEEEIDQLIKLLERYRKKEKFSYYKELPETIKKILTESMPVEGLEYGNINQVRNMMASKFYEYIIDQYEIKKEFTDLEESMRKAQIESEEEMCSIMNDFNKETRSFFVNKCKELAIREREAGNEDKAKQLEEVSYNYTQSYTLEDMYNLYKKGNKLFKIKPIELEKFDKTCRGFNRKYQDSQFIINDVSQILPVLVRHIYGNHECTKNDIKVVKIFITLFIKYTNNMTSERTQDHVFMYYFIKNILTLDHANISTISDEDKKFYNDLLDKIKNFCNLIREKEGIAYE